MSTKKQHLTSGHLLLLILPSMETRWTPTHSEVYTVVSSSALSYVKGIGSLPYLFQILFRSNRYCDLRRPLSIEEIRFFLEGSINCKSLKGSLSLILTVARIEWLVGLWPRLPWGQPMSPGVPGLAEVPPRFLITHSEQTLALTQHTGQCQAILRGTTIVINPGHTTLQSPQ